MVNRSETPVDSAEHKQIEPAANLQLQKKSRRRWYQFTLGKLLLLLLLIGLLLVKPARILHQTGREMALREAVLSAGGQVKLRPITGDWLRWALGAANSSVVFEVTFSEVEPPADLLARLDGFPHLANLFVGNAPLRDADLMTLPDLPELKSLGIARTLATGSFLRRVKDFPNLRALSLTSSPVTDEHIEHVASFVTYILNLHPYSIRSSCPKAAEQLSPHPVRLPTTRSLRYSFGIIAPPQATSI